MNLWGWYSIGLILLVFTNLPELVADDTDEFSPVWGFVVGEVWLSMTAMVWPALFILAIAQFIINYQERT